MRILVKRLLSTPKCAVPVRVHRITAIRNSTTTMTTNPPATQECYRKNILVEKYGGIQTINIDRQDSRNSLNVATMHEITAALDEFDKDESLKVLIIHGEGGTFSSGFDIDEMVDKGLNVMIDAAMRFRKRPLCDKTTIAAVAGFAVAEGFELALACDLRIVEDTAVLGCLGRRFGVPQNMRGAERLTSQIGLSPALDLLITGRRMSGIEAHQRGLTAKLTSTGTALGEAVKLAKSLTKFPQSALIMDKMAAIYSTANPSSDESLRNDAVIVSLLGQANEDIKSGMTKFQHGIGRHGKFYKLTEVPLKDWELEDSTTETTIKFGPTEAPSKEKVKAEDTKKKK